MSEQPTVFICSRGPKKREDFAQVRLDIPRHVMELYKQDAKSKGITAKAMMEEMIIEPALSKNQLED